jgi:hypothetical protein
MSNQIYYDKYTKYKLKYDNLKMQLNNQKGGGDCLQPQLMPPIFTMMYQYMKNKNIKYLTDVDISHFLETKFKKRGLDNYIELCSKLFNDTTYYKIEKIHDRIYPIECKITNETDKNRLLFINFKSSEILNKDHREKFFKIITETSPDYICLTEALVPTSFVKPITPPDTKDEGTPDTKHKKVHFTLNKVPNDIVEHPMKEGFQNMTNGSEHSMKTSYTQFAETKKNAYKNVESDQRKLIQNDDDVNIDEDGNVTLNNVWIKFFVDNGYNYLSFGNPTLCPYGENWGNCIISKREPITSNIFQMESIKIHNNIDSNLVKKKLVILGTKESRCMVHITMDEYGEQHHIICTHLEDSDKLVRKNQVDEIIDYISNKNLQGKITLVGDLNAINSSAYTKSELMLLTKLSITGTLPTDAVKKFNKFFEDFDPEVTLINRKQKYESVFQKCVSHGYSNTYTDSLLIFTDATTFDHQPLLLLKGSNNEPKSKVDQ